MKNLGILFGTLSLVLMGGVWNFPSLVHASPMSYPISFYNYSLTNTVTTTAESNTGSKTQNLAGSPTLTGNLTDRSTLTNLSGTLTSKSSIAAALNPASTFITQTVNTHFTPNFTPSSGRTFGDSANANSIFSVDFNGTGHRSTFYVIFNPRPTATTTGIDIDGDSSPFDYFQGNLSLTVTNQTANKAVVASLVGGYGKSGSMQNMYGFVGGSLPGCPGCGGGNLPGPFFLYLTTVKNDVYNVSVDLNTSLEGRDVFGAGKTTFDLVANTPEPSTIFLLTTGLAIMALMGVKRQNGGSKVTTHISTGN
ncbi:MAG: PEP-CTERM sorting domain-containing protein [Leptospirales bacterium]